jgi:hypothetical protein
MLIKNLNQKRILFAENGVERWQAAPVARAMLRRITRADTAVINKFDVIVINRMHEVLHTGGHFNNPFMGFAAELSDLEVRVSELGF